MAAEGNKEILPVDESLDSLLSSNSTLTVPPDDHVTQQLVDPRSVYKHYDPHDLVSLAKEIQQADQFVKATTSGKLQVIVDQMRYLQEQAHKILKSAKRDSQLHHAACNFVKIPGKIYHLYEKTDGTTYFSMLSPEEWGKSHNTYIGSYRLEYDRSWTPLNEVDSKDSDTTIIHKAIMSATPLLDGSIHDKLI